MVDKSLAMEMWMDGKTMKEIGEYFGVSRQRISILLKGRGKRTKDLLFVEKIPYKGLYEYFKANTRMSVPAFVERIRAGGHHSDSEKMRRFLLGENSSYSKRVYDNMLAVTGMTYEQLFELREGFES